MNQDDKAFGQQLLRVILGNPQLQSAIGLYMPLVNCVDVRKKNAAQAICPRAVTALLQNEQFKSGCIQQVARTFEQNQVNYSLSSNWLGIILTLTASILAKLCCSSIEPGGCVKFRTISKS